MNIEVRSFYDRVDKCKKFYSLHGVGLYYDTYEEALREELIALGLIIPICNNKQK